MKPSTEPSRAQTQAQLERLLAHPLFSQSKRYPALLRFVVEQTLEGNSGALKERSLGVQVFGRDPGYDLAQDPVVRVTAAEVRKRLAQFYYDPQHAGELRVELPTGSYVPTFLCAVGATSGDLSPGMPPYGGLNVEIGLQPPDGQIHPRLSPPSGQRRPAFRLSKGRAFTSIMVLVAFALGELWGFWLHAPARPTSTQRFWAPLLGSHLPITVCTGAPKETAGYSEQVESVRSSRLGLAKRSSEIETISDHYRATALLHASDVTALSRIASAFAFTPYRIMDAPDTDYSRLQEGPSVLVGGIDNGWTMRLTQALPFRLAWNSGTRVAQIVNAARSSERWQLATDNAYESLSADYAVVARYRDGNTGQFVAIVAGLGAEGTEAASELVSNPVYTDALFRNAPKNWRNMNVEAVVSTSVIHGEPGPPQIVAETFW